MDAVTRCMHVCWEEYCVVGLLCFGVERCVFVGVGGGGR